MNSTHHTLHPIKQGVPSFLRDTFITKFLGINHMVKLLLELPEDPRFQDIYRSLQVSCNLESHTSGKSNLPKDGPLIVAANHPYAFFDSISLAQTLEQERPSSEVKIVGNENTKLMPEIENLIIPTVGGFREKVQDLLTNNGTLIIFPGGETSYRRFGKTKDVPWKKGVLTLAKNNDTPIIPAYIDAKTGLVYNFGKNILPRRYMEYFNPSQGKRRNISVRITFGEILGSVDIDPEDLKKTVYGLK